GKTTRRTINGADLVRRGRGRDAGRRARVLAQVVGQPRCPGQVKPRPESPRDDAPAGRRGSRPAEVHRAEAGVGAGTFDKTSEPRGLAAGLACSWASNSVVLLRDCPAGARLTVAHVLELLALLLGQELFELGVHVLLNPLQFLLLIVGQLELVL